MSRTLMGDNEDEILTDPLTTELTDLLYGNFSASDEVIDLVFQSLIDIIIKYADNKEVLDALKKLYGK